MTDPIQHQLITARKNQILDAAAIMFAEKGFHPTTIHDIAKQAGIADGTIYNYFPSKPALLMGIFERMRDTVTKDAVLLAPDTIDLRAFIRNFLYHPLMALKADNFVLFRFVISEMLVNEELRALYYQQIMQPVLLGAEAIFNQYAAQFGIDPPHIKLVMRAISGMMLGLILEYAMGDEVLIAKWEDLPDILTEFVLNGLRRK